jgi:hypothetical protein
LTLNRPDWHRATNPRQKKRFIRNGCLNNEFNAMYGDFERNSDQNMPSSLVILALRLSSLNIQLELSYFFFPVMKILWEEMKPNRKPWHMAACIPRTL